MQELIRGIKVYVVLSVLTGFLYPGVVFLVGHAFFSHQADGSLIQVQGKIVGSELIGQNFMKAGYFHGRPSSAHYDAANSGASNFGPTNAAFIEQVKKNVSLQRSLNGLSPDAAVPADLVLASGSGLDPDISLEAAQMQVQRVAKSRGLPASVVEDLLEQYHESPFLNAWGMDRVNVLKLNLALDNLKSSHE